MKPVLSWTLSFLAIAVVATGCNKGGDNNSGPAPYGAYNTAVCTPGNPSYNPTLCQQNNATACTPGNPAYNPAICQNMNNGLNNLNSNDFIQGPQGYRIANRTFHLFRGYGLQTITSDNCAPNGVDSTQTSVGLTPGRDDLVMSFDAQGNLTITTISGSAGQARSTTFVNYTVDVNSSTLMVAPFTAVGQPSPFYINSQLRNARIIVRDQDLSMNDQYGPLGRTGGSVTPYGPLAPNGGVGINPQAPVMTGPMPGQPIAGQPMPGQPVPYNQPVNPYNQPGFAPGLNPNSPNVYSVAFEGFQAALSASPVNQRHIILVSIDSANIGSSAVVQAGRLLCQAVSSGQYMSVQAQ